MTDACRRRVLHALAAAALAVRSTAYGQAPPPARTWRVGVLSPRARPPALDRDYYGAFPRRLAELGYVEGRNLAIDWRFRGGDYGRLPALAGELVAAKVDAILALGPPGMAAARGATATIPIVVVSSIDPVAAGYAKSLSQPGGNVTGLSNLGTDLGAKHVELLLTMAPAVTRLAVLVNPGNAAHAVVRRNVETAAGARVRILAVEARTVPEIEQAFATIVRERAGAVVVSLDPLFIQQGPEIARQAASRRLPSISANREYAEAGGLMSYGQNQVAIYRRAAEYVDRILKGASPARLPIEQPATVELVINGATAKALGLAVPQSLRISADTVLE